MHCCKLFLFEVTLNTHLSRVMGYSAQMGKYRLIKRLPNTLTLSVSVSITVSESRNRTGQGWCLP